MKTDNQVSFPEISLKTTIVHIVSYFIVGFISYAYWDYSAKFADPAVAGTFRQTTHPLVAAGPLFQVLRGFLFGIAFYLLRAIVFPHKFGWVTMWGVLVIVGILSPFGAAPGSIEGVIYTVLPLWFHLVGIPEIITQAGLLAFLTTHWVNHPEQKWLGRVLGVLFAIAILMSVLGILDALGFLPPRR